MAASDIYSDSSVSTVELDADHYFVDDVDSLQSHFRMAQPSAAVVPLPLESIQVSCQPSDSRVGESECNEDGANIVFVIYRGEEDGSVPEDVTHVAIEEGTTQIAEQVFRDCNDLVSIEFPSTGLLCTTIGYMSFGSCWSLGSIALPQSLNHIGPGAFHDCQSLTEISLPPGIRIISRWTFHDCSSLRNVSFPSTLNVICENAFAHCIQLQSIELPHGLQEIQSESFRGCKSLVLIAFPSTLEVTGENIFRGAKLLQEKFGESNNDIIRALTSRFSNLPLHQLCYSQAFQPLEITLQKFLQLLDSNGSTDMECIVDTFGMTPFHVLALSSAPHQTTLFQALASQSNVYSSLLDRRDIFGRTPLEYLCMKDTSGAIGTIRYALNQTVGMKVSCLGLERWRQRIGHETSLCCTKGIDRIIRLERIQVVYDLLEDYISMEKTSIMEQALWKAKIIPHEELHSTDLNTIILNREASRIQCGADVVISNVLSFGAI